jgi:serine/threonine protein kinase
MAEQKTARTILADLVQLEKLSAELERRFRIDPSIRAVDVLANIDPDDHVLYLWQLEELLGELQRRNVAGTLGPVDQSMGQTLDVDVADGYRRSLMATAMLEDSTPGGSAGKPSGSGGRPSGSGGSGDKSSDRSSGSGPVSKDEAEVLPERIDQFRIISELGAGAFGVVYLAEDESLQRKVAIKVPKVSDPKRCASYINEARKAAAIDCKGIVPIYHVGTKSNGIPFIVQKLIDGSSLRLLLERCNALPPAHAATLMRDVAIALGAAHRLGIYHRDLKPDNILIDTSGVPWIADFGLAISESEQAQKKGEVAGTLLYMSPEQIQGRADWLDGRSDLWAIGVMLYELLLGKPPFGGRNRQALMEQICHREPRPLQQSSPMLESLNDVFMKCCAKSPNDRYASAEKLVEDLTALIDEGLSVQPIDGSELRISQPISQYPSGGTQGSRQRSGMGTGMGTGIGSGATQVNTREGTTRTGTSEGAGSGLGNASGRRGYSDASYRGSGTSGGYMPSASSKLEQWTRVAMIGVGIVAIGIGGTYLWNSGQTGSTVVANSIDTNAMKDETVVDGTEAKLADTKASTKSEAVEQEPELPKGMSLSEANGTQELPWVVAADGTGSHKTLAEAIAASEPEQYIQLRTGHYVEALKITHPLTLIGPGEPKDCLISNTLASPIEIACPVGAVRISNVSIRGDAIQAKKEFNAIQVNSGKLYLDRCEVRSSTWNGIKVLEGGALDLTQTKFFESSQFAVSGKNHDSLTVTDCEFYQSGVQAVGGPATIEKCVFRGVEGVYIEQSGTAPSAITKSEFLTCLDYGVTVTDQGDASITECTFDSCKFGARVYESKLEIGNSTFDKCKSAATSLTGGSIRIDSGSKIQNSGSFGCWVQGGKLEISDSFVTDTTGSGIIVEGDSTVSLNENVFSRCGSYAIHMIQGTLGLVGGSIEECDQGGIVLSEKFAVASINGTKFLNNLGGAIVIESGELTCENALISGGDIGLLVRGEQESPVKVVFSGVSFEEIEEFVADVDGAASVTFLKVNFGEIPEKKHFQVFGGAEVNVEL